MSTRAGRAALALGLAAMSPTIAMVAGNTSPAGAQDATADRQVVISIDDLPYIGEPDTIERATRVVEELAWTLRDHDVPAEAFVTGSRVWVDGQVDARIDLLRQWRDAGARLGGHGFHHVSFQTTPFAQYVDDVIAGLRFPIEIMGEIEEPVRYYRHPFNHTGPTAEAKRAFVDHMAARGVEVVPFTVEHADYVFSALYDDAEAAGDTGAMRRVVEAYLEQLDIAFDFAESLALDTFGRPIPHVFLIHANAINAASLGRMLDRLAARGYRFVAMDEALADPSYATPDDYVNRFGVSWLHRWREGMGLPNALRSEPDPPAWIMEAYADR